jgi:hypothetical protein
MKRSAAMAFSVLVEGLNMLARCRHAEPAPEVSRIGEH